MKIIRLLYPDHLSGGMDTYDFGANLLAHILPPNDQQPLLKVEIAPPDGKAHADVVGLTIAEYLPFDEHRLHNMLDDLPIFHET